MATDGSADSSNAPENQLKKIARAAAERSAARRAALDKKAEQARAEHERRFKIAAAALENEIAPLLEQAKLAFESEGVPVEIITNFEEVGAPQAQVAFQCAGPFWSNAHGAVDLATSDRAIFSHDGTDFNVGIGKSFSKQVTSRTRIEGEVTPQVLKAVEAVVDSFFLDVERRCRR
jgi:hypothetical protein